KEIHLKNKQKWQRRSFATDFIVKGLFWIILFVVLLFSFNYAISGSLYASEFWDMIGGVLAFIASFIALIFFARRAIIEGYYISVHDCVMATFYTDIENDPYYSKTYHDINKKYADDVKTRLKALEPLQKHYFYCCFKEYIEQMNWLEKFVICLYSAFTVGSFSTHLELSRARRRNWFEDKDNDFL
ncbi:TPA: hypothetical protein ACIRGX_002107, partial [Streptococcus suis]